MNSDFLRWLLNVKAIPKGSESLRLVWEHPWPNWAWTLLLIGAGLFAAWSYSNLVGRRGGRGLLAAARFVLLVLILIYISGPMLELPRETIEQDWVLMLADRSASMTIRDAAQRDSSGSSAVQPRVSRDEQLQSALKLQSNVINSLADEKHVVWLGFDAGSFNLAGDKQSESGSPAPVAGTNSDVKSADGAKAELPDFTAPNGRRTNINTAIEQALQRAAARPVSGVVLFSDGRTDDPPSRALVRRLQADAIPVYVVPLGSSEPVGDLAIRRVESPRRAFVHDKVPVVVEVEGRGFAAGAGKASVKLIDQGTKQVLDAQEIDVASLAQPDNASGSATVTLTAKPELEGEAAWVAVIEPPGGASDSSGDLIPENNSKSMQIDLINRPLRVLYVEGYPRWEYRYVKNLLVREKTIESSVMLISADRDFAQEGNQPITRLPRSPEEFAAYDVIILGDVPASFFSPQQLEMIRAHVADRGAGLLWIAGQRSLPSSYVGTAVADLLPMRGSLKLPAIGEPVTMVPTPLAERLGVLQLTGVADSATIIPGQGANETRIAAGWPAQLADPATGWSRLFYAQRIEPGLLKPAVEVLAQTAAQFGGAPLPLVLDMRYGAGQSIYVATDEIWRWRYGRGELLPDQFWVQMIRMLGRESLAAGGDPAMLEISPRRVAVNQPIRIELRLLDAQLLQSQRTTVRVALENESNQRIAEIDLQRVQGTEDRFAAVYLPDSPGELRARVDDSTMAALRVQTPVEVFAPDDELQKPQADHDLLVNLAQATGGRVLKPDELDQLKNLPNRAVRTINPLTEPIWDSPLALMLAVGALTAEWIGRKVLRLV